MKATAQVLTPAAADERGWVAVYLDLFKARLTLLVLITTLIGFYMGCQGPVDYSLLLRAIVGTALLASGAAALNQLWERRYDAHMRRTRSRPLPSGRLQPATVLRVGLGTGVAGFLILLISVNVITGLLGAISIGTYLFIYTPLKRVTWWNTAAGAIPGALPPLMGWTAARGHLGAEGLALFAIQAFWQVPHFMAIAWLYREEYARAGFKMLPLFDPAGRRTARQAVLHALVLLPLGAAPYFCHFAGPFYLAGALALGLGFLWTALSFARELTEARARQLFLASILYLPLVFGLMVIDKVQ